MQVSRHWRMKTQRYRLTGVRYNNGEVSMIERPIVVRNNEREAKVDTAKQPAA